MTEKGGTDSFELRRGWVSQSERQGNSVLNGAMASEQLTKAPGRMMDIDLNMTRTLNATMGRYLGAMNMPTRQDVLTLGDRLTPLEERSIAIEAMLAGVGEPGHPTLKAPERRLPPRTSSPMARFVTWPASQPRWMPTP
jgi:hypothetical protein